MIDWGSTLFKCGRQDSGAVKERRPPVPKILGSNPMMSRFCRGIFPSKWRKYWLCRQEADIERD